MMATVTARMLAGVLEEARAAFARLCAGAHDLQIKTNGSPVTAVGHGIDRLLRRSLLALVPDAGWLSQESVDDPARLRAPCTWVVDPLDGTKGFATGIPEYAVSIGLVRDGQVIAGAVMNPATGEAAAGTDGSWLEWGPADGRADVGELCHAVASVRRTEWRDGILADAAALVAELRPIGSVAYKLLRVARGCEHLTFTVVPKSEWDICGGVALIANRRFTAERLDGRPLVFNSPSPLVKGGLVAGLGTLAAAFREQLAASAL